MSKTYAITDEQITAIISTLDRVAKSEGLSLQGSAALLEHIVKPITSLQQITINPPVEDVKESVE